MSNDSYIYTKIWIKLNGPIPKDWEGRSYEIHHIDGDHENNDPSNLKCVSIREHYDIHWFQEDYGASLTIAIRMNLSSKEKSLLASLAAQKRVKNKTHHFLHDDFQKNVQIKRIQEGTHHFLKLSKKRSENGTHHFTGGEIQKKHNQRRLQNGTHHLLGGKHVKEKVANGTHNFLTEMQCPFCLKSGKGAIMLRWHFNNCKYKEIS